MKKRTRTLHPEGLKRVLLDRLKDDPEEPAIKRVAEILSMLVTADSYLRERIHRLYHEPDGGLTEILANLERMKDSERAYYQTLELLNIKLSRYRWEARLSGGINGFSSEVLPAVHADKWEYSGREGFDYTELWSYSEYTESFLSQRDELWAHQKEVQTFWVTKETQAPFEVQESFMISTLLEVVNEGQIWRFRHCLECHEWLYAIRKHQQFCSDTCRRRHEAQNPAFKKKRAQYMRERYRPLQKELEQRSIELATVNGRSKGRKA